MSSLDSEPDGLPGKAGVAVEDIRYAGPDGSEVEAFLVSPERSRAIAPGPGLLLWHWLDTHAPDGNRTQFLDEAAELAVEGVVSLLPQGRFPWAIAPSGGAADRREIELEVARLVAGLDLLAARRDVDDARLAVVGHDFGGMLGTLAAAGDPRLKALVVVAATPRWGDWFLPFWDLPDDRIEYLATLRSMDPIEVIGQVTSPRILFQFARQDFFIALMSGREFHTAAPEGADRREYDAGHDMRSSEIRGDRLAFLRRELGLGTDLSDRPAGQAATT